MKVTSTFEIQLRRVWTANRTKKHAVRRNKGWRPRKRKRTEQTLVKTVTPAIIVKARLKKNKIKMRKPVKKTKRTRKTRRAKRKKRGCPRPSTKRGITMTTMRMTKPRRKRRKKRRRKKKRQKKKEKKEKKKTKKARKDEEKDDDDNDEDSGAGGKGQASKKKAGELEYDDDELKPVINMLQGLAESKGDSLKAADYLEELTNQRLAKNFDQKTSLYVTMEALCGKDMDAKELEDKATYFDEVIGSQKLSGIDVLWALGAYLGMNSNAKRFFAQMLKVVYERDWAEEKTIMEFYSDEEGASTPAFANAQQAASPCLKWLAEVDEDEDEDSD